MVRCHLENAVTVWSPYCARDNEEIELVQKRATKMLPCTKGLNYEERLGALKLPTLRYRRIRMDIIETYKMLTDVYDKDIIPKFEMRNQIVSENRANRRHSEQIYWKKKKRSASKLVSFT